MPLDILILRDPRESTRKCSLTPLRGMPGVRFLSFDPNTRVPAGNRILLHAEGSDLTLADRGRPLLLLDCAWRRVQNLLRTVEGPYELRRLPPLISVYRRHSKTFADPTTGLASVEALYAAVHLLDGPHPELLAGYHFAQAFLDLNPALSGAGARA